MSDQRPSPTDSPWLWLAIFISGAIVALVIASPKYAHRQAELEREFLARQRGGQTITRREQPTGAVGRPVITLRPLIMALSVVLLTLSWLFWLVRWLNRRVNS